MQLPQHQIQEIISKKKPKTVIFTESHQTE